MNSNEIIVRDCLLTLLKSKYKSIIDIHVKFDEEYMFHWVLKHGIFSVYLEVNDNAYEYGLNYNEIYNEAYTILILCNLGIHNDMDISLTITPIIK